MGKRKLSSDIAIRGFVRLKIKDNGRVVGDSGWVKNTTTDTGIRDYLVDHIINGGGEKNVSYAALGSGGTPAVTTTQLPNEFAHATNNNRLLITGGTSIVASKTAQWTGQFASSDSYITASTTIGNIGIYSEQSDTSTGLFAGVTYTASTLLTNQNVDLTYQIRFSSA